MWALYAQWRFRGVDPFEAVNGQGAASPWPGRVEAVVTAFALEAAGFEKANADLMQLLPAMLGAVGR